VIDCSAAYHTNHLFDPSERATGFGPANISLEG
jgi:hypothetical protein